MDEDKSEEEDEDEGEEEDEEDGSKDEEDGSKDEDEDESKDEDDDGSRDEDVEDKCEDEDDGAFVVSDSEVDGFCVDCGGRSTKRSVDVADNIGTDEDCSGESLEECIIDSFVES